MSVSVYSRKIWWLVLELEQYFFYIDNQIYCTKGTNIKKKCRALVTTRSSEFSPDFSIESNNEENGG